MLSRRKAFLLAKFTTFAGEVFVLLKNLDMLHFHDGEGPVVAQPMVFWACTSEDSPLHWIM